MLELLSDYRGKGGNSAMFEKQLQVIRGRFAALILTFMFSASLCLVGVHGIHCSEPLCEICEQNVENVPVTAVMVLTNESDPVPIQLPVFAPLPRSTSLVMSRIRLDD